MPFTSGPYDGRTPYDDEPDVIEVAGKFLEQHENTVNGPGFESDAVFIIRGLLEILDQEGIT